MPVPRTSLNHDMKHPIRSSMAKSRCSTAVTSAADVRCSAATPAWACEASAQSTASCWSGGANVGRHFLDLAARTLGLEGVAQLGEGRG